MKISLNLLENQLTLNSVRKSYVTWFLVAEPFLLHSVIKSSITKFKCSSISLEDSVQNYVRCRNTLMRSVLSMGTLLALGALATGFAFALFEHFDKLEFAANLRDNNVPGLVYKSSNFVLYYGLLGVVIMGVLFAPIIQSLRQYGHAISERWIPQKYSNNYAWSIAYSRRKEFEESLDLSLTSSQSIRIGLAILTPLIGAIASFLTS